MGCCMAAVVGGDRDSCMGVPWDKHYGLRRNLSPRQGCPFGTHPLFLRARPLQWRQQALVRCSGGDNFKLDLYCNPPTTCPESLAHRPSDGWGINRVNTQVNRLLRRLPMFSAPSYILGNNVGAFPLIPAPNKAHRHPGCCRRRQAACCTWACGGWPCCPAGTRQTATQVQFRAGFKYTQHLESGKKHTCGGWPYCPAGTRQTATQPSVCIVGRGVLASPNP